MSTSLASAAASGRGADHQWAIDRLDWMQTEKIWPEGYRVRYLWTDALGLVLLLSLWHSTQQQRYLDQAHALVEDVYAKLGDARCMRIGLESKADKYPFSYAHYNALWLYALYCFSHIEPAYRQRAIDMVKASHPCFMVKGRGIWWKIYADGSGPQPGHGFGGLDHFDLYSMYRLLDPERTSLASEIADVEELVMQDYRGFDCDQDLGLGMTLWTCSFFPEEAWARTVAARCLTRLEELWVDKGAQGGYFARAPWARNLLVAFANCGVGIGLQAALTTPLVPGADRAAWRARVQRLHSFLDKHAEDDPEYAREAITWVMMCNTHYPGWLCPDALPSGAAKAGVTSIASVKYASDKGAGSGRMEGATAATEAGAGQKAGATGAGKAGQPGQSASLL